jgi:preprotein translocase subunit SecD
MSNLKYRLLLIGALVLVSLAALFPRTKTIRAYDPKTGTFRPQEVRYIPLKKGLDLSGGMYFALGIDDAAMRVPVTNRKEAIERALKPIRTRVDGMGVSETVVQTVGDDQIVVQIPGAEDPARARSLVEQQAFLEFLIVDRSGALEKSLGRLDAVIKQRGLATAMGKTGDTAKAAAVTGLEGLLKTDTANKVASAKTDSAQADSVKPGGALSSIIRVSPTGMVGEYVVESKDFDAIKYYFADSAVKAALPPGKRVVIGRDSLPIGNAIYRTFYVTDSKPLIDGSGLTKAQPTQSPTDGTIVSFELNNEAGRTFGRGTRQNIDRNMAIVLDGMVITAPVIRGPITTRGQITMGGKDLAAAQDLALVLQAGALPVKLKIEEQRQIGPSLGEDSIRKGITAGLIGIALVILIMVVYYRFSGMLAVLSLGLYVLFTAAILASFGAALTLPGLAGFVLSIGIAVDANVLIFERIREELDHGKTIRTAIDEGFRHAMPAIIDSNVSAILTSAVLYQFGTGPVKGFAVTLVAGIVASLVTSIFVVRTFYLLWLNRQRGAAQTLSI